MYVHAYADLCCVSNVCQIVHVDWRVQMHVRPLRDTRGFGEGGKGWGKERRTDQVKFHPLNLGFILKLAE